MMKFNKQNLRIKEVPVSYNPRTFDEGKKLRNIDALRILWVMIKYRFVN
jgi:dolichol-phosphate mannosyltransferase